VLAGITRYASGISRVVAFVCAALALAGLAWVVSFATEQVGIRFGHAITGFMQSTIGNLPEFFVVLFALAAGERTIAETAILGAILSNALLVLGIVIVVGARRAHDGVMRFSPRLPNDTATLLLLSTFIIVLIGLANAARDPASKHTTTISIVGAAAILIVYCAWTVQYLRSAEVPPGRSADVPPGRSADVPPERSAGVPPGRSADVPPGELERPKLAPAASVALLALAGTASAFVSDWFVNALEPTIHALHITEVFAGLVIVAIAGNAAESVTGIVMAAKGRSELAISIVKNAVAQIAAFLYPVLVLVSLLTVTTLTFALAPVYIGALFGTAVIVWQITGDGEATLFEGAALIATFVILATVAAFE